MLDVDADDIIIDIDDDDDEKQIMVLQVKYNSRTGKIGNGKKQYEADYSDYMPIKLNWGKNMFVSFDIISVDEDDEYEYDDSV